MTVKLSIPSGHKWSIDEVKGVLNMSFGDVVSSDKNIGRIVFSIENYRGTPITENSLVRFLGVDSVNIGGVRVEYDPEINGIKKR